MILILLTVFVIIVFNLTKKLKFDGWKIYSKVELPIQIWNLLETAGFWIGLIWLIFLGKWATPLLTLVFVSILCYFFLLLIGLLFQLFGKLIECWIEDEDKFSVYLMIFSIILHDFVFITTTYLIHASFKYRLHEFEPTGVIPLLLFMYSLSDSVPRDFYSKMLMNALNESGLFLSFSRIFYYLFWRMEVFVIYILLVIFQLNFYQCLLLMVIFCILKTPILNGVFNHFKETLSSGPPSIKYSNK